MSIAFTESIDVRHPPMGPVTMIAVSRRGRMAREVGQGRPHSPADSSKEMVSRIPSLWGCNFCAAAERLEGVVEPVEADLALGEPPQMAPMS